MPTVDRRPKTSGGNWNGYSREFTGNERRSQFLRFVVEGH
jgi:hypothetical protein